VEQQIITGHMILIPKKKKKKSGGAGGVRGNYDDED
jgi:hypothetical protein